MKNILDRFVVGVSQLLQRLLSSFLYFQLSAYVLLYGYEEKW